MGARLHESMAKGKLTVQNRTCGEVMLYYPDPKTGERAHVVLPPLHKGLDLLAYTNIAGWRKSPNLKKVYNLRHIGVIL